MKFYKLLQDFNNDAHTLLLKINQKSFGFNRYDADRGIWFDNWTKNIKIDFIREEGDVLDDYVANNLAWFVVSDKFKKLLEQFELGKIQFLPLYAVSEDGKEKIDNIYLCNICNLSDALNLENSTYFGSGDNIRIAKYALNEAKIDNYDIFRLKKHVFSIFISEQLMKAMKKDKITGCDYGNVKMI